MPADAQDHIAIRRGSVDGTRREPPPTGRDRAVPFATSLRLGVPNREGLVAGLLLVVAVCFNLTQGRHFDLWLSWVDRKFGLGACLATVAVMLLILASALVLLRPTLTEMAAGRRYPAFVTRFVAIGGR